MAVAYSAVSQPGLFSQQYPPPLLPKPGKDNVRLQKLLKRTAKKKASAQASQSAAPFRSSLSPVNEASPDLEHSDHSTPPRTPEVVSSLYGVQQPPRYTIRPLYQHVASPYPQRAAYGRGARFSPQTVAMPSYSYSQHVTTVTSYSATHISGVLAAQGPVAQAVVPKITLSASPVPDVTVPSAVKKPAFSTFGENHAGLRPALAITTQQQKPSSLGPTPYPAAGQSVTKPLTVLTQFIKPKSPRPTFKATEPSKSPKPMFDVPQIRMYTATTSYYEISRTPPVYDTSGLTSIGITIPQSIIPTETKQDLTPANEVRRGTTPVAQSPLLGTNDQRKTPTSEMRRDTTPTSEMNTIITHTPETKRITPISEVLGRVTPTPEIKRVTPTPEIKRVTPTPEIKRVAPTPEIKRVTPTPEIKRLTPTPEIKRVTPTPEIKRLTPTPEIKRVTPTPEIKRLTPTPEIKRLTPTSEIKRTTPTSEIKRTTPTPDIRVKTPTYEFQTSRTSAGRPKTPAYHVARATTPVFEISKPNPLLFAVSPINVEAEWSKTKPDTMLNGDIHSGLTPTAKPIQQTMTKAKSEPDLTTAKIPMAAGPQRPTSPTSKPTTKTVASYAYQRSITPTYEASRLMTTSPGYKRPKTPTGVSPVAFQRPQTPTQAVSKSKSGYRGLTPAEYAAYGGIKTYSPAFGILNLKTSTQEEVKVTQEESVECKTLIQEPPVKIPAAESKVKDMKEENASTIPSIPTIVVSQASDTLGATIIQETIVVSSQIATKPEKMVIQEEPKAKTAEVKTPENQKGETPVQEVTKLKTPKTKHTLPQDSDQDPLKAVRKLLGKDKLQTTKQMAGTETKADVSQQKEPKEHVANTETTAEDSKPSSEMSALPVKAPVTEPAASKDKGKEVPEKKEGDESLPAAESLLKVMQKPKGMKSKMSGWSRLKKHMVVEPEEPKFPDSETGEKEATGQDQSQVKRADEKAIDKPNVQDESQTKDTAKATKMWDAVLFQMFSTKENIMHQIELNKSEEQKKEEMTDEVMEIPSFAYRLPVLLFSPRFDAKKLKEAASRPVTKISTVFEMGLIGRKGKDEEPKDFNRTARGFTAS